MGWSVTRVLDAISGQNETIICSAEHRDKKLLYHTYFKCMGCWRRVFPLYSQQFLLIIMNTLTVVNRMPFTPNSTSTTKIFILAIACLSYTTIIVQ